jgi:hypothetical protein
MLKHHTKALLVTGCLYSEDVASTGLTPSELRSGGTAHDQWPKIETALIERAKKSIAIHPISNP